MNIFSNLASIISGSSGGRFRFSRLNIGDWNMDTTATLTVAHGLTFTSIRSVNAIVRNDADDTYYILSESGGAGGSAPQGGVSSIDADYVNLFRLTGGVFDTVAFDATTYNRGYIFIIYEI